MKMISSEITYFSILEAALKRYNTLALTPYGHMKFECAAILGE